MRPRDAWASRTCCSGIPDFRKRARLELALEQKAYVLWFLRAGSLRTEKTLRSHCLKLLTPILADKLVLLSPLDIKADGF